MALFETVTFYNLATGKLGGVTSLYEPSIGVFLEEHPGQGVVYGEHDGKTQYVDVALDPHVVVSRPIFTVTFDKTTIAADSVDFLTITGVPVDTEIHISDVGYYTADGNDIEVTLGLEGSYRVRLDLFPYQRLEQWIDAN